MKTLAEKITEHATLARAAAPRARRERATTITVMLGGTSSYWEADGVTPKTTPDNKPFAVQLRVFDATGENDQVLEELPPPLSPFAARMLKALRLVTKEREQHPCGGFTTDDIQWRLGTAFTAQEDLDSAIEEMEAARLIRFCGFDADDAIGTCYGLREEAAK